MATVQLIPVQFAARTWPAVAKFFEAVLPFNNGSWTLDQIKADVLTGRQALAVAVEGDEVIGACSFVYQNRQNDRVAFVYSMGGEGITTPENWAQLADLFRKAGATRVEAAMRPATQRLWARIGFTERYRVCGVNL